MGRPGRSASSKEHQRESNGNTEEDEIRDIKTSLKYISARLDSLSGCRSDLTEVLDIVKKLRKENEEKEKKINELQKRIDHLEQHTRCDEVIISGLNTHHTSFAHTVAAENSMSSHLMAPQEEQDSLEQCVANFIAAKTGIKLDHSEVSACHTIHGKKNTPDMIMKFINRKTKLTLLKKSQMLKGTGVYINEHLTQKNALIAKEARKLRREKKILAT